MAEHSAGPPAASAPERFGRGRSATWLPDGLVCLAFALLAVWLTHGLWSSPARRALALNERDQVLYEWLLANDARVLFGDLGLLTDRLNAPDGVNLLANTSVILLGVLLAPVTIGFGSATTFAVLATGNLALTASAWYFFYSRTLGARRTAAALGAGLCGFAPGMVSQSNGHLHMTAQWLVPVMLWLVVRLLRAADAKPAPAGTDAAGTDTRRIVTSALGLAVVAVAQVFIGEEVLFLAAITLLPVGVGYAILRPTLVRRVARRFGAGILLASGLALLLLAYPLWFQFDGPQSVRSGLFDPGYFSADRASWPAFSPLSLAGSPSSADLAAGAAEYNTFLGWPLLLVVLGCAVWLVQRPLAVACFGAAVVMADLSLGPRLVVNGVRSGIPGPYALLTDLPLFESALPTRFALAVVPLIATVLVIAVDRALPAGSAPRGDPDRPQTARPAWLRRSARFLAPGLVIAALVPIFPRPLPTADRPAVPEFITSGHWQDCVQPGGVLVPVPLPTPSQPWSMRWGAAANAEFAIPEGMFIGPYGQDGNASMGKYQRPTSALLADVAKTGTIPMIGAGRRHQAQADMGAWGASCVVLDPEAPHTDVLYYTLQELFGPGTRIADVWTWRL